MFYSLKEHTNPHAAEITLILATFSSRTSPQFIFLTSCSALAYAHFLYVFGVCNCKFSVPESLKIAPALCPGVMLMCPVHYVL